MVVIDVVVSEWLLLASSGALGAGVRHVVRRRVMVVVCQGLAWSRE